MQAVSENIVWMLLNLLEIDPPEVSKDTDDSLMFNLVPENCQKNQLSSLYQDKYDQIPVSMGIISIRDGC